MHPSLLTRVNPSGRKSCITTVSKAREQQDDFLRGYEPFTDHHLPYLVTLYISKPDSKAARTKAREGTAVLYLTDVFGIVLPENKLFVPPTKTLGITPPVLTPALCVCAD
jgi:hypothetical protein